MSRKLNGQTIKAEWFSKVRADLLAGIVVALALIPEAIAFSIIAGVDPKGGLYASFCIAVVTAFFGGRSGMISAATGAMALLMVTLVKDHGLQYLLVATLLTGVFQIIAGVARIGDVMRFVSRSVITGFVNALAILIFMAQLPEFKGAGLTVYVMVAAGLAIIYILPRFTKAVPSPLVTIIVLTVVSILLKLDVRHVGDLGELPSTLPVFLWPQVPWNFETLRIVLPYSLGLRARFFAEETTRASYDVLEGWVRKHGLPASLYVDRDSIYPCEGVASIAEQLAGKQPQPQFGRAMEQLGTKLILANSPQAKGRVERMNGTLQDRLVKEMRLAGINDIESANRFLEGKYLRAFNRQFARAAAQPLAAHRKKPRQLNAVLSWEEERVVQGDWTVACEGKRYPLDPRHEALSLVRRKVIVRTLRNGRRRVF